LTTYASQVDDVQVTRHELTGELVDVIYARLSLRSESSERANRLSNAGVFRNSIEGARRKSGIEGKQRKQQSVALHDALEG